MNGIARNFMLLALSFLFLGVVVGLYMAISQDHAQATAHAHIMLAGWVTAALCALFYRLTEKAALSRLAQVHFWLQAPSTVVMTVSLLFLYAGHAEAETGAAVGSVGFALAVVVFAFNVVLSFGET